ncbi:MAG TPA: metallopeptidase family protein, partial [Longimicrobiales bacterium]
MNLRSFEELAEEYWAEIPDDYKHGVDGVRVLRGTKAHDELPDVWTMGECVTEAFPSEFGSAETTRSAIVLYHGSFEKLADQDDAFDWEDELWETITHELRHHLESLAAEDALEDVDYAADENFKRQDGAPFDPFFYRSGEPVEAEFLPALRIDVAPVPLSAWRVEGAWFFETTHPAGHVL